MRPAILGDESKVVRFPLVIKEQKDEKREEGLAAAFFLFFAYTDWNFDEDVRSEFFSLFRASTKTQHESV